MVSEAEAEGAAARFTGAGAGGAVWALGKDRETASRVREAWEGILTDVRGGGALQCAVDYSGARLEM